MAHRILLAFWLIAAMVVVTPAVDAKGQTEGVDLRLIQGATAYVANPQGAAFDLSVDVRQWHLLENGPRELLIKVYDPDGRVIARRVVEDDGVTGTALLPEAGGWDHEMWYYTMLYSRGTQPMIRWSSFTDPARLAAIVKRTFDFKVPAGKKGVYRVLLAGSRDHVATLRVSGGLKYGLAGHPLWMHGHGDIFRRSFVYVPRGTVGINIGFAEYDQPVTRYFKVTAPDGAVLWNGTARGGFQSDYIKDLAGKYDDQVLTIEVTPAPVSVPVMDLSPTTQPAGAPAAQGDAQAGAQAKRVAAGSLGDFMMHIQFTRTDTKTYRGGSGVPAIYCPDAETAKTVQGGAIYHDGLVFWHGFQVRFYEWVKANLKPEDMIVRDEQGNEIKPTEGKSYGWNAKSYEYKGLPESPGFVPLNGAHEPPPLCDTLMHNYTAHKNRAVLNIAIADLEKGIRNLTVGDHPAIARWGGNLGYVFGTYGWHYWRPAWRVMQQSDAPQEVKDIIREAIILGGDRLAMSAGQERTNGNAMSHIPMALRYAAEGTKDETLTKLANIYFDRFAHEGWGRGAGISKSGDCQEHFAHDFHYGSYIYANYSAIVNDLNDPKFKAVLARIAELYTYLYCPEAPAYPWGSRTAQQAGLGSGGWKGKGGPDFTVSVNGGDEWFAARRPTYYALTFHGRLAPEWLNNYFASRLGYGGGMICQLTVPGRGVVLAGTLHEHYGIGMQRDKWRDFHIHSIVGTMADGQPLVAADSEHLNASLDGTTVTGSGEIRDRPLHVIRQYTFNADSISVAARLRDTEYRDALWNQGPSSRIAEAYEMIPFLPGDPKKSPTIVAALDAEGKPATLGNQLVIASAIVIDRGGYGVKIELDKPMQAKRGANDTLMLLLADRVVTPDKVAVRYTLRPFIGAAPGVVGDLSPVVEGKPITRLAKIDSVDAVAAALAKIEPMTIKSDKTTHATIRVAVSGHDLAIDAEINDPQVARGAVPWEGSELELYASPANRATIRQVFLLPQVEGAPATALIANGTKQSPAPDIRISSSVVGKGYRIQALVPLETLGLKPDATEVFLEFQVSVSSGAAPKSKMNYFSMFGSKFAYENNRDYARFKITK